MKLFTTCLAFASHLGVPRALHDIPRNIIHDETQISGLLKPGISQEDAVNVSGFWDHQGIAFAKINLSLQLDPASDVERPLLKLVTLMQKVLWGDHVSVRIINDEESDALARCFDTTSDGDVLLMIDETAKVNKGVKENILNNAEQHTQQSIAFPFDDTNLISKALKLVRRDNEKYLVLTKKRVPPGSGLGGGSADAAYVLKSLGDSISNEDCLKLGSDVAFLASHDNIAVISGFGEEITPMDDVYYKSHVHILIPDEPVSTREVFYNVRERLKEGIFNPGAMPLSVEETCKSAKDFCSFKLFNALEQCISNRRVRLLLEILQEYFPKNKFRMSGSGCSFFLLGADDTHVIRIRELYGHPLTVVKTRFKHVGDEKAEFSYL